MSAYAARTFYAVDRYCSFKKERYVDYEQGVIIADRYATSNAVHQCSKLPKYLWDGFLDWIFDLENNKLGIPAPDAVMYLGVDPKVSQSLISKRYHGHEEKKDIHERDTEYLNRCKEAADYCTNKLGWTTIERYQDDRLRSVEDISGEIVRVLMERK